MSEPIGYIPDVGLKTLTDEKKFCVANATKFDETDIPLYTTPKDQTDRIAELEKENNLLKEAYDIINNNINLHFPTKQTNPLSDEEIKEIIRKHRYEKDLTILCRAIEERILGK